MAAVQAGQLLQVVWVSLAAGIGATVLFSLVVFGSSRATEARRAGANPSAYGLLAAAMLIAFLALVALALVVILNKD
ncbi:MAG: hypothetical protein WKF94_01160 [Solirubrobacteraceae bacterium]